jgi:predicted transcriptional regulator
MKANTRVITAHVPIHLAETLDQLTEQLDRSRGWIIKQALTDWITQQAARHQLTLEALADVDAGNVISQQAVLAWANSLGTDNPLPIPGISTHED